MYIQYEFYDSWSEYLSQTDQWLLVGLVLSSHPRLGGRVRGGDTQWPLLCEVNIFKIPMKRGRKHLCNFDQFLNQKTKNQIAW